MSTTKIIYVYNLLFQISHFNYFHKIFWNIYLNLQQKSQIWTLI